MEPMQLSYRLRLPSVRLGCQQRPGSDKHTVRISRFTAHLRNQEPTRPRNSQSCRC